MRHPLKLAVVGAGLVGRQHIAAIQNVETVELAAVVEPVHTKDFGAPTFPSLEDLFEHLVPDGVILSTPTPLHVSGGLTCIDQGVPTLVEKPLANATSDARILTQAAQSKGVPLLVGHHRRYNPLIQQATEILRQGELGTVRAAQVTCWFYKPDDYFDAAPWRKQPVAGPLSVNLVHDVDLMRHFLGEVATVQAQTTPSLRGYENEDLAAAILRFESGALCTITVSDSVVSPWSWELTSEENPIYPTTNESCYLIGGSEGALSIPDMRLWQHDDQASWWHPIRPKFTPHDTSDPMVNQIVHFADVIRGNVEPLVSGEEGLRTLQVIEAIQRSADTQDLVRIEKPDPEGQRLVVENI